MADEITPTTKSTIESIFGSLNITTEDKGKFLTVDNNFNPYWQNINETSVGDSWAYTQFSTATIVQLPKLSTSIGGIVAVLRNDKTSEPAYIILQPQGDETIMGQSGVWANNVADENYASVVLKAVSYTDGQEKTIQTWVIVNGVNTWNNFASKEDTGINTTAPIYNIRVQKIGSNTLSGGVGMSGVEFVSFKPKSDPTDTAKTKFSYLTEVNSGATSLSYVNDNTNYQIPISTGISRATGTTSISSKLKIFNNDFASINTYAFNVAAPSNFSINKATTNITTLYAYIALNNTNNSNAFALYKVSGKFTVIEEGADKGKVNTDSPNYHYIPLFSIELTDKTDTDKNSIGRLIEIPIDDSDIDGFTIAFESEEYTNNTLNFDFIGVAQEKAISISPEVEFENCGILVKSNSNTLNWDTIDNYTGGSLQIFNDGTAYKPGESITKTIFKFSQIVKSTETDLTYTKNGTLLIDWLNAKYYYNATYYNATTNKDTSVVDNGSFYDKSEPIVIKSGTTEITFTIDNFGEAIASLPIKVKAGATVSIVIENYKTQYSTEKEKYDTPIGSVIAFAGANIPENWYPCDGRVLKRNKFPELAKAFDVTSDEFNLPDLRDRFIMGVGSKGSLRSTVEAGLPNITGMLQLTQEHQSLVSPNHNERYTGAFVCIQQERDGASGTGGTFDRVKFDASLSSSIYGRNNCNTVQPPSVILYYIIKVK